MSAWISKRFPGIQKSFKWEILQIFLLYYPSTIYSFLPSSAFELTAGIGFTSAWQEESFDIY